MKIISMLEDKRKITSLMLSIDDSLTVGCFSGFTEEIAAIKVYQEPGQDMYVLWFAIVNDAGFFMARVNAAAVQMVLYDG